MTRKRGRPIGSYGKKRREAMATQQRRKTPTPAVEASRDGLESDLESVTDGELSSIEPSTGDILSHKIEKAIEKAINAFAVDLRNLKSELRDELKKQTRKITNLEKENKELKDRCTTLEEKVSKLERDRGEQFALINKQERFSRRNNVRIVGHDTSQDEDCIQIAKTVFKEAGLEECRIERAHRDGKIVHGRNRHILVKLSFYQDKLFLMKNARLKLQQKPYFLTDDLTLQDLREKKKWATQVSELYRAGTRLHFSGGVWRHPNGKPYKFTEG